jgi:hypothetical protein
VSRTEGYSGSDVRNLIQEACQGPVRSAVAEHGEAVAGLSDADLRPVRVRRAAGSGLLLLLLLLLGCVACGGLESE